MLRLKRKACVALAARVRSCRRSVVRLRVAPPPLHAAAGEGAQLEGVLARRLVRRDRVASQLSLTALGASGVQLPCSSSRSPKRQ